MLEHTQNQTCVVIGASHAGVNFAFSLRKQGYAGNITLIDIDPTLPYHRPPLSKAYLTSDNDIASNALKAADSYIKENIKLMLGTKVAKIDAEHKHVIMADGTNIQFDQLVIATGARPFIPPIEGLTTASNLYPLRTAADVTKIKTALKQSEHKRVVIIGGGYIGLETAASMQKLGAQVTVLEREERILARVTAPEMSSFFQQLHADNGVNVLTSKNVASIQTNNGHNQVICADGEQFDADVIVVGVGIRVNSEIAADAGLTEDNGIHVNESAQTNVKNIYAIGDCAYHYNPHFARFIRLESVQNALDQGKVAAANICGKDTQYDTIPWFWSDQYDIKLQMVGLSQGYNKIVKRTEPSDNHKFSVWYFKDDELLAVDAVNNAKAYVLGTKFIKNRSKVDKQKLADLTVDFKADTLVIN
ncbi:NAD(P)/FAD-dependent oxidoreductase [Psychrosphaera sp. F3M07]|uniref:NAD(P)/FAD-dependent oxidoreductase n=1 Tax=Psychrosphaera sp. F3M07 TaxID=2841560 RepID=UPI001C097BB7|nr:FAD/NAD(P)-binding oxidoreductase [Psychrosphaera sp. F3M07]MBU2918850.1 NAD(P)/FAD-dependent oxidoreductase [Psychrosphaera sp. F3M07]